MKKTPLNRNQMHACSDASIYLCIRVYFPDHSHRASNLALSKKRKRSFPACSTGSDLSLRFPSRANNAPSPQNMEAAQNGNVKEM